MGSNVVPDQVVDAPTYMADIRFFFRPEDVEHMAAKGIDLSTYEGVKRNALSVFALTSNGSMPPDLAGRWSADRLQTFLNWITNNCPLGTATPQPGETGPHAPATTTGRLRKNVAGLEAPEIEKLETAFKGVMDRDPSQPDSYFALAGIHSLPQMWCLHHQDRFNPWHRVYLKEFEDALRSVRGCEDVTLPYWDLLTPLPELLQRPPFASYTLPQDPGATASPPVAGEFFPYTTQRYTPDEIVSNLQRQAVLAELAMSLEESSWGAFNENGYQKLSIQAHDGGHGSIGPTMAQPEVASYDPVFWFFHCNLDRLWLAWQRKVGAETLTGFKSTLSAGGAWLSPPFNPLPPFQTTADETIAFGITYDDLELDATLRNTVGSVEAARSFTIRRSAAVSVRVKGIHRLNIPGSFVVKLLADGEPIAERFFFQPRSPRHCENCSENAVVNIDFRLDQEALLDRELSVDIEVPRQEQIGARFPLSQAGDPTINARLLLEEG